MIRLIVAYDRKRGIAKHGFQPWYIPDDETYFSRQTKSQGGNVLMGRTTLEVMGKPLSGRNNYVLTSRRGPIAGAELVHDLEVFMKRFKDIDLWVIGGASVYKQILDSDLADELYITHIDADFGCDQFFPEFSAQKFQLARQTDAKNENGFSYRYAVYAKRLT